MEIINAVGRRKAAVARVFLKKGKGEIIVNQKSIAEYFPVMYNQMAVLKPLQITESSKEFDIQLNCDGGGVKGQAEAAQLAIARALVKFNAEWKPALRANNCMTRNAAEVERKKPGHRKARRSTQFSKR
jgi:small subunit ribosomal protein S9